MDQANLRVDGLLVERPFCLPSIRRVRSACYQQRFIRLAYIVLVQIP